MAAMPWNPTEVASFRDELRRYGIVMSTAVASKLLQKVGSRGIALDAMLMAKRPAWLAELTADSRKR